MLLFEKNYIGESYILDKLIEESVIKKIENNEQKPIKTLLYNKYINQHYLYYLLNNCYGNYSNVFQIVKNVIKYRKQYNLFLNEKCELCYKENNENNEYKPVHSIIYKGFDKSGYHIIYIEPANACDFTVSAVCQHLLMCFDTVINNMVNTVINENNIINNVINENNMKIKIIFNMKENKNSLRNIKIAKAMYNIINDCYIDNITEIQVYNFGSFMKFFTKLFCKTFNNKIKCY